MLSALFLVCAGIISGCGMPKNKLNLYQRSMVIETSGNEKQILAKATIKHAGSAGNIRVLRLEGTPYEMGFQHGVLLRDDIQKLYGSVMFKMQFFAKKDMMDEIYDLMDPYIPAEEKEEMRGLAHGAGVPLKVVHWMHSIPEVWEYGEKKRFRKNFMATSCSNIAAFGKATADGRLYHLRVLDWARNFGVQKFPVILVHVPQHGNASVTFSYAGFIGCISGMNASHMSFGEMGYGDPLGESLEGIPFIFLFRKLMRESNSIEEAEKIIRNSTRTCSYIYLVTDAKSKDDAKKAAIFITDRTRVVVSRENTTIQDERDSETYPAIDDVVYGGAKADVLHEALQKNYGVIMPNMLVDVAKSVSLSSNMQNVIFDPERLEVWVSNATMEKGEKGRACLQEWTHFDFKAALSR